MLGTKYWEAGSAGAVQVGNIESIANFLGYKKIDGQPEFHYRVNNVDVYELITPLHSVIGVQFTIYHTLGHIKFCNFRS